MRALDEKNFHPLMTHSSPSLTAAAGELLGIRARLGLGHGVTGEDLAVEQRLEVLLLLVFGAVVGDDLGIAGVGGLGPEHDGRPGRHAEDLVEQGQLDLAVALAAELGTQVGGPQVVVPHLLLHRIDDGPQLIVQGMELLVRVEDVERLDLVGDELACPVQLRLELRFGGEIPGHRWGPFACWLRRVTAPRGRFPAGPVGPGRSVGKLPPAVGCTPSPARNRSLHAATSRRAASGSAAWAT